VTETKDIVQYIQRTIYNGKLVISRC